MKLPLILIFFFSLVSANEELIYKDDTVKYFCVNGYVKADITFTDGTKDLVKVVWVNPHENKQTTILKCENFKEWEENTEQY